MTTIRGIILSLALFAATTAQLKAQTHCYPGFACPTEGSQSGSVSSEIGSPVTGFSYTQAFVVDTAQNLVWSRNLYAIGDTTKLFKDSYARNESIVDAYAKAGQQAATVRIGGHSGWRLATRKEVDSLLTRLLPTTVYAYFRARTVQLPISHVLATLDAEQPVEHVAVDGMIYENTAGGRVRWSIGSPERNPYGVWLVRNYAGEVEKSTAALAQPLRQYLEPIEELRLAPTNVYQLVRRNEVVELLSSTPKAAKVATTSALNTRFYARYNLKGVPRGALVVAEVQLRGRSSDGSPAPIVKVETSAGSGQGRDAKELWAFEKSTPVGIWQMPEAARLELPSHIARNAYSEEGDVYLSFVASYNTCEFDIPELIVHYVREQNVLARRQLP